MQVGAARRYHVIWTRLRAGAFVALLALLFTLLGGRGLQDAVADGDTRTLSLRHIHTGEDLTVTFRRNGRYDEAALQKLNWFLRDWRTDDSTRMDPRLFDLLWELSREFDAKEPIHVVSAYRSPQTNSMLRRRGRGVAMYSQHTVGRAMDFFIPGAPLEAIRIAGLRLQRGGVGFYPRSGSPFVHVDTGSVRHWPRMTPEQLARVFPDGRTVHIPSNGQPLKGYALALADIERRGATPSAVSLAAARNAGVIGSASSDAEGRPKRSFLAKLLGFGPDEEDDAAGAEARLTPATRPTGPREIAAVPMPLPRPQRTADYRLAAAPPSATEIIETRGYWSGEATMPEAISAAMVARLRAAALASIPAAAPPRPALADAPHQPHVAVATPRPRPPISETGGPPETTASVASLFGRSERNDRIPTELALAYAEQPAAEPRATSLAAPMGGMLPTTVAAKAPPPHAVRAGQRNDNPWLRGLVVAPSLRRAMTVAVFGPPDHRQLRPFMHKPRSALAMFFSRDSQFGMIAEQFTGAAVAFLPTVTFIRTARLGQ